MLLSFMLALIVVQLLSYAYDGDQLFGIVEGSTKACINENSRDAPI